MKADEYDQIYDQETYVEEACKKVFAGCGAPMFGQGDADDLPEEHVDVVFKLGAETGHRGMVKRPSDLLPKGQWARDAWNFSLEFTIYTKRMKAGADGQPVKVAKSVHRGIKATIRMGMEYFANLFTEAVLPYHTLTSIETQSADPTIILEDVLDVTVLIFSGELSVRTGAWPEY
jgi:hypothetical protein